MQTCRESLSLCCGLRLWAKRLVLRCGRRLWRGVLAVAQLWARIPTAAAAWRPGQMARLRDVCVVVCGL